MQRVHLPSFARLLIFYSISVLLASVIFNIQDYLSQGKILKVLWYIPMSSGRYLYPSLAITLASVWIMTHFIDRRPFVSLGLQGGWFACLLFLGGFLLGLLTKSASIYTVTYFQMGLLPKWPFLAPIADLPQFFSGIVRFLITSVYEELFFRGYLLQTLLGWIGVLPAVLMSSIAFGLVHLHILGWIHAVNAGLLGLLLGIVYVKTRSLWTSVGLHLGHNLIGSYWGLLGEPTPSFIRMQPELLSSNNPLFALSTSLAILIVVLLPLRPHPQAKALWDRYIHPAPWPPWRRRRESEPQKLQTPVGDVANRSETSAD